jgi:hypothetical protein
MREEIGQVLQVHKVGERGSEEKENWILRKHECQLVAEGVVMKTRTVYICDICGEEYKTEEKARACERILVQCPLYEIGDTVRVLTGEGKGEIVEIIEYNYIKPSFHGDSLTHKIIYTGEFDNGDVRGLIEGIDCEVA